MPPLSKLVKRRGLSAPPFCAILSPSALSNTPIRQAHQHRAKHVDASHTKGVPRGPIPPQTPGRVTKPSSTSPSSGPESETFTTASIPPISFFKTQLPIYGSPDLTPSQCHEAATLYCDGNPRRDLSWAKRLLASHPAIITPYTLHYLGLILHNHAPTKSLGLNMLATAHDLGFTPSTLQLVLLLEAAHPAATRKPSARLSDPIRSAVARHEALVRAGKDPSALALYAHLLTAKGNHGRAAEYFSRAYRAGMSSPSSSSSLPTPTLSPGGSSTPRKERWLLEGTTLLVHGQRLLKEGKRAEAEAVVRIAASELDQPQAYAALAKIVEDEGERREFTLKAAMAGIRSACEGMAKLEGERAREVGIGEEERRVRGLMAREWELLSKE